MKTLGIVGAGDLGQQIAHYALYDGHYEKIIFFDDFSTAESINNIPLIGKTNDVEKAFNENFFDELLIAVGYKYLSVKKELFEKFERKIPFGKIIHSTALIDPSARIESGAVIYPGCIIDANVIIKGNAVLNIACAIAHDTIIGRHSFLSPRVAVAGFTTIGERCFLGINSTIIDNLKINDAVQIGAGTVVIKSIEKSGLYAGNPARFIK